MKRDLYIVFNLVKRGFKVFLKDKASVFFSFLSPLIVLIFYVLFLKQVQIDGLTSVFEGVNVSSKLINSFADNWMLSGVIAVSCITVSFSATGIMVADKESDLLKDFNSSPIKKGVVRISYYIYNIIVTLILCLAVLAVVFIYLAISGWSLTVMNVVMILVTTIVSVILASITCTTISSFIKTMGAYSGLVGILSAASGFLIGAYMPLSSFPKFVQYIVLFIPSTYPSALYRNYFLTNTLNEFGEVVSPDVVNALTENYSLNLDFFGTKIGASQQWIITGVLILVVGLISVAVNYCQLSKRFKHLQLRKTK